MSVPFVAAGNVSECVVQVFEERSIDESCQGSVNFTDTIRCMVVVHLCAYYSHAVLVATLVIGALCLQAFVKRILYVCACHSPSFACGCLVLLSEVCVQDLLCTLQPL